MEYHYVVAFDNTVLAVFGKNLREMAFESAARHRANGVTCEVFTRAGKRLTIGLHFPSERIGG